MGSEPTRDEVRDTFERTLEAGDLLFAEGDPGDALFVVASGELEVRRNGIDGPRILRRAGPGDLIGALSLWTGGARPASAVALGPTRLLELDADDCREMCEQRPDIALRLVRELALRGASQARQLADLDADDCVGQVARALLRCAEGAGSQGFVPLVLRQLAAEASLPLFQTYRALHRLIDRKLVRLDPEGLALPDPAALQACVLDHAT